MMYSAEKYHPVDCDLHDYLEIACLYRYMLRIELTDGTVFDARAVTTRTTIEKEEYLVVERQANSQNIRLDCLSAITALTAGAKFSTVLFASISR
ncbi:Rho-binding antiterminator [Citrobacter sp. Res13-Sevr-PEB04-36]|uniref:Rho-binding antiterminator n=1 Tax=Citrobacter sp. Res13-Sevr-PEB04-36 TaxID=2777960 RepID=UPI001E52BEA0|nr:Rho-binding antiterminator [Citrobacter sp. Res13-Sevr-PEB04-36]